MNTMRELRYFNSNDPLIHACLQAWMHGDYPSWEACLIDLCCQLAKQNEELKYQLGKVIWKATSQPNVEVPQR